MARPRPRHADCAQLHRRPPPHLHDEHHCLANRNGYNAEIMASNICLHFVVSGTVQGVCFRAFTRHAAKQLNLTGWVKNLENGNVEILACGNDASLAIFKQQVTQGSTYATVDTVQCEPFPWEDLTSNLKLSSAQR